MLQVNNIGIRISLYDKGEVDEGIVRIYYGSATGYKPTADLILEENVAGANFGWSVSGAGDINKDGYNDLVVGAYKHKNGETDEGKIYVYLGSATGLVTTAHFSYESNDPGALLGWDVNTAGDINLDGYDDIIAGAPSLEQNGVETGGSFVFYGGPTTMKAQHSSASLYTWNAAENLLIGDKKAEVLTPRYNAITNTLTTATGTLPQYTHQVRYPETSETMAGRIVGAKMYELTDHLGNVRVVVSDLKEAQLIGNTLSNKASVLSYANYYPFGSEMPGRNFKNSLKYRYGFNTQEKVDELGEGHYTAMYWEYDSRLGRRWNQDPKPNPSISNYSTFANNPIFMIDPLGDTTNYYTNKGKHLGTIFGEGAMNDRIVDAKEFNKILKDKSGWENATFGNYNIYMNDDVLKSGKTEEDFIWDDTELETFINDQANLKSTVIDLNSDLGKLARIGYAEFRGGNNAEKLAALDITLNRVGTGGRPSTLEGMITQKNAYTSLNTKDPNRTFYLKPYSKAALNTANFNAWTSTMEAAISIHSGNTRGVAQGATLYYSPRSMDPAGSEPNWDFEKLQEVTVDGVRTNWLKMYIEK